MLITIKTLSGRRISLDFEPTQKINKLIFYIIKRIVLLLWFFYL